MLAVTPWNEVESFEFDQGEAGTEQPPALREGLE
jgi:hypothetical protein